MARSRVFKLIEDNSGESMAAKTKTFAPKKI